MARRHSTRGFRALGCLVTLLASSNALAINWTNAPDAQQITAGATMFQAMAVDTSASWSLQRMVRSRDSCSLSTSTAALPIGFGLDSSTSIGDPTRALTWTGETSHAGVGTYCVRVRVCELFSSINCIQKTVEITVVDGGNADAILTPHRYTARENNTTATRMRFEPQYTIISPAASITSLLSVASCPTGATDCNGTTLPPWVSFAYDDDGLYFDATPPFGARGDWTFTSKLPAASTVTKPVFLRVLDSSRVDPEMKQSALAYLDTGWVELNRHYPEDEASNDDVDTAPYIERGWVIGDIHPAGDVDYFQFYVANRARHAFFATDRDGTGCNFDLSMSVHRVESDSTLSAALATATGSGPGACATIPPQTLPEGETYVLKVHENGDDAIGYEYVVEHLIYEEEGEEASNTSTNPNQGDALGYWFEGEQLYEPGLWGTLSSTDYDWAAINLRDGDTLNLRTSNGNGGCSGDTFLRLYRFNSSTDALSLVASDDDSGVQDCSAISYTATEVRENLWVRVSIAGKAIVRSASYFLEAERVPTEHNTSAFSWSSVLTGSTHTYDRYECDGAAAFFLDDFIHNADWFTGYGAVSDNPSCNSAQGATFETDGMGVCRERGMNFLSTGFWKLDDTRHGTRLTYAPYSPFALGTPTRAHVVAHRADTSLTSSATGAFVGASYTSSGVHLFYEPYGQCDTQTYPSNTCVDGFGIGGSTSKSECVVSSSYYYEGERAVLDLTRYRSAGTLTLSRCSNTSDDTCGQALPTGASLSGDRFTWDIPYNAAQTFIFPFESTYRFKVAWSYGANYYIQLRVRNRGTSSSGADLNISEIREEHPLGYQAEDVRITKAAYRIARNRHQENLKRAAYLTNTQFGRSLARYDRIHVHPSFENGSFGDNEGPANLHVRVENDGTLSSSSTTVEAYLLPAYANSSGGLTSSAPSTGDTPYLSTPLGGLGAGGSTTVQLAFPAADALTSFGHEPWQGGARALDQDRRRGRVREQQRSRPLFLHPRQAARYPDELLGVDGRARLLRLLLRRRRCHR